MIQRRHFAGMLFAAPIVTAGCSNAQVERSDAQRSGFRYSPGIASRERLTIPTGRPIKVGFAINPGVQVIDVAGPWETFQDTYLSPDAERPAFEMFTVSETRVPIHASGGLTMIPDFTIENAPAPDVIVVPHFDFPKPTSHEMSGIHRWIKASHDNAALTMSVCTGAFQLAKTGLLDGIPMTTNRLASDTFAKAFPAIDLRRGPRFIEAGRIATSGGLSAGIDLALRVVARSFGDEIAQRTADRMEYVGTGWRV